MKKILIVTTGQPSVNPRVVKEADALHAAGHDVTVLYCFWIGWAEDADRLLLKNVKWSHKCVGGSPSINRILYHITRVRFRVNKLLNRKFGNRFLLAERSQARCYDELLREAKSIKADWYIGHNLGALSIAVKAAAFRNASAGFDFEDYHREENNDMHVHQRQRVIYLESKYVEKLQYVSTSSLLITKIFKQNFPSFSKPVINLVNCFPLSEQPLMNATMPNDSSLRLFWFSQTVGPNRGLEIVLDALKRLDDHTISLTLIGGHTTETENDFRQRAGDTAANIHFAGIVSPPEIFKIAATMHVGLALELRRPYNRDICLTNKIFTYILAGNAILLSETSMQKSFNEENNVGESFEENDAEALASKIVLYKSREKLNGQRLHNYQLAQKLFNWEAESKKLLKVII